MADKNNNEIKVVKKRATAITQETALRNAEREGKSFTLVRKIYPKNDKFYYSFSAFFIFSGPLGETYQEAQLLPSIGYLKDDDKNKTVRVARNSTSYRMLNWIYDSGNGIDLIIKSRKTVDGNTFFDYYAYAVDESGISVEVQLTPKTPGDGDFLRAAFAGFGKARDWTNEDLDKIKGFKEEFTSVLLPGCAPDVDVEDE